MKSVICAVLAMIGYAVCNVMLELKFAKYNTLTIVFCYSLVVTTTAILARLMFNNHTPAYDFPSGSALFWLLVMGLIYALADFSFVGAYTTGGSILMVSSIVALFPVFASMAKFAVTRQLPNLWQVGGYLLAFVAIILVAKGEGK